MMEEAKLTNDALTKICSNSVMNVLNVVPISLTTERTFKNFTKLSYMQ